jgi:IS5 family transposase
VTINADNEEIICTAFGNGSTHDFQVFKASKMILAESIQCLADRGYQGLDKVHANSRTPAKKSKHHPLTPEQKAANRELARRRILAEHVIRKLKIFRILSERYRNRRKRFKLRFNLIAAIYNLELKPDVP